MNIESPNKIGTLSFKSTDNEPVDKMEFNINLSSNSPATSTETKHALDEATGLLQTIVTEKLSDEVIRKIPADEYLQLLSMLDDMLSGSIDKQV